MCMKKILFLLIVSCFMFYVLYLPPVFADQRSASYRIEMGNLNIGAQKKTSSSYNLTTTLGQTVAGQFNSTGYIVKAGFQYINSIIPFRFSVSSINLNLGTLTPGSPSTATTNLTVSFGGAGEYYVKAFEDNNLRTLNGSYAIPDTACNGGAQTCSISSSNVWNSSSAYGFGYNMSGNDIPADFTSSSYFRPFANKANGDSPQTVMSNTDVGRNRQSTMTVKTNISNIQQAGSYQTIIKFIAIPSY